ncbi:MAG: hypothetical protein DI537_38500 [Stutzerimonas stutzeri]|jgi:hypothetical protein|nr:MAG: hypothetical protein DI537_38500 [Stutzerimonas stutzeri]
MALLCNRETAGGDDDGKPPRDEYPKDGTIRVYKPWYVDLGLRAAGLFSIAIAALSVHVLMGLVSQAPLHDATWLEMLLAAAGFLGGSIGCTLLFLGSRIYDRVVIASRWRTTRQIER